MTTEKDSIVNIIRSLGTLSEHNLCGVSLKFLLKELTTGKRPDPTLDQETLVRRLEKLRDRKGMVREVDPGFWGLTSNGLSYALHYNGVDLKPIFFYDHILAAMGRAVNFQANLFVSNKQICYDVMTDAGMDFKTNPHPWFGHTKPQGLRRKICHGFRNMRPGFLGYKNGFRGGIPLTLAPIDLNPTDKTKGMWALSEAGVLVAKMLNGIMEAETVEENEIENENENEIENESTETGATRWDFIIEEAKKTGKSYTITFLDYMIKEKSLLPKMSNWVSIKCPTSSTLGLAEDHCNQFLLGLMERDALAKYVTEGTPMSPSKIAAWAVKGAISEFRSWAQDGALRSSRGASTKQERDVQSAWENHDEWEYVMGDDGVSRMVLKEKDTVKCDPSIQSTKTDKTVAVKDGTDDLNTLTEFVGGDLAQEADDQLHMNAALQRIHEIIRKRRSTKADVFIPILEDLMEGYTVQQIADNHGMTKSKATSTVSCLRDFLKEEKSRGHLEGWF